jgi:murein DD-endopeptidase MepM/ murein hydrolase activator NlpD
MISINLHKEEKDNILQLISKFDRHWKNNVFDTWAIFAHVFVIKVVMKMSDSNQEQSNPVGDIASQAAQKGLTEAIKKNIASKAGAESVKSVAGVAGGPVGVAVSAAVSIITSSIGQRLIMVLVFMLVFLTVLSESLPSIIMNSIFHTNPYHSSVPTSSEEIEKELRDIAVVRDQETAVVNVVKNNLQSAYNDALQTIPVMCMKMGVESGRSLDHLIDNTENNTASMINAELSGETIDDNAAFQTVSANDYGIFAIVSAYSVSVDQLKPKKDESGFHLFQLFEQEKSSETDITQKISKYYKQSVLGTHGNNIYKVTYVGEEGGGNPTIFDDKETKTKEDGTKTVIHHYYIKPVIHNFDVQTVCEGTFGIDFDGHYEGHADNVTISQAVATLTNSYMALMNKTAFLSGNVRGNEAVPGGSTQRYVFSLQNATVPMVAGSWSSPFDADWKKLHISSYMTTRLDPFGSGKLEGHRGIDWPRAYGSDIRAIKSGKVIYVKYSTSLKGMGYHLAIDHGGGIASIYAHCSIILVKEGDFVTTGQKIAEVGSTGRSTGPHLHLEVIKDGQNVNPLNYLP